MSEPGQIAASAAQRSAGRLDRFTIGVRRGPPSRPPKARNMISPEKPFNLGTSGGPRARDEGVNRLFIGNDRRWTYGVSVMHNADPIVPSDPRGERGRNAAILTLYIPLVDSASQ